MSDPLSPYVVVTGMERDRAISAINAERLRQLDKYTPQHDDQWDEASLGNFAALLALDPATQKEALRVLSGPKAAMLHAIEKHQHDREKQLVIAGALIVAELERIYRAKDRKGREMARQALVNPPPMPILQSVQRRDEPCGFVPPTPGYAPCTRTKGHDGPCAHDFVRGAPIPDSP